LAEPMKANRSTRPEATMGVTTVAPSPEMMLTTPGGKLAAKSSSRGMVQSIPSRGNLTTTGFPMTRAGNSVAKVSFSG
jgi:hypothetical protein